MSEAMYCRVVRRPIKQAEKAKRWPRDCVVCLHERGQIVSANSQAEGVAHREKEHRWLADRLRGKRKRVYRQLPATDQEDPA
jgi:hypothetical protein